MLGKIDRESWFKPAPEGVRRWRWSQSRLISDMKEELEPPTPSELLADSHFGSSGSSSFLLEETI